MSGWSDASFFAGQRVVVVGAGDHALETALVASKFASDVLVYGGGARPARRASLRAREASSDRIRIAPNARVLAVEATKAGDVAGVRVERDGTTEAVECSGVFVAHPLELSDEARAFASRLTARREPRRVQIAGAAAGIDEDDHARTVEDALRAAATLAVG